MEHADDCVIGERFAQRKDSAVTMDQGSTQTGSTFGSGSPPGDSAERLKDTAGDVVQRATDTAGQAVGTTVESGLDRAADFLDGFAGAVRRAGEEMREEEPSAAGLVETAAGRMERASSFLRENDIQSIVGEVEDFARRQPVLFLGGALALGAFAARFLKASPAARSGSPSWRYRQDAARYGSATYPGSVHGHHGGRRVQDPRRWPVMGADHRQVFRRHHRRDRGVFVEPGHRVRGRR
jgi:hypothetical protein